MQCLRQLLPHRLLFIRQFYVVRERRFIEHQQKEGYFQIHQQQQKEDKIDNEQVSNIYRNDVGRAIDCSSYDDEIESWRAQQITLEECHDNDEIESWRARKIAIEESQDDEIESWRARQITMEECTKSIPKLV